MILTHSTYHKHLQAEPKKQLRIDSSETKFRQIEHRFEELTDFSQKRCQLLKEQINKLEKCSEDEHANFINTLQEKSKSLAAFESQFSILIEHEIKVNSKVS